jgi:RecF/RecN/SMC N terminal domain
MVVYGQNGAGKTSFVDAIEYAIQNGKLAHLSHEYSGRYQEKAIPNTHTPKDRNSAFGIKFIDDSELNISIAKNGAHTKSGAGAVNMQSWDYRRTVLRQDEVSRFIHDRKGEKYSSLLPLFGLQELEVAAENLRQLVHSIKQQSKFDQKLGALEQADIKRKQVFGDDNNEAIGEKICELHKKYCSKSEVTDLLARCNELETTLTQRINELSAENQQHLALRTIADTDIAGAVKSVRESNAKLAKSVEPLIAEKLEVLQYADNFAEKLKGDGKIECPACGLTVDVDKFKAHVKTEQERLQEIIAFFQERKTAVGVLIDRLKTVKTTLGKKEIKGWRDGLKQGQIKANVEWVVQCNAESFRQSLSEQELMVIEDNCLAVINAANDASQNAPPEIKDLSKDKGVAEAAKAVFEAKVLADKITHIQGLMIFINSVEGGIREEIRERSKAVIGEITNDISTMWKILHPGEPIENVRLVLPEDDKAIDIALKFHGMDQDSPRLTLSEGYRNSLGLCIFLAMAKREADNDQPLFLDDVVISLDRHHRGMIVELLEKEFAKRQLIVFTHDRDWFAELRQQLDEKHWDFKTLLPYQTPLLGIRWSHKTTTFDDARAHLNDRPDSAGNDARKIMDIELGLIAEKLQLKLPYLRGDKNDKRMWSEFLERLVADASKCFQKKACAEYPCYADAITLLDNAGRLLASWGNRSSHTYDVVRPEASKLIDDCESALQAFRCTSCKKPVWFTNAEKWVQCQCGELRWRYGKG